MQEFKANEEEGGRAKEAEGSWLGAYTYYTYIKESFTTWFRAYHSRPTRRTLMFRQSYPLCGTVNKRRVLFRNSRFLNYHSNYAIDIEDSILFKVRDDAITSKLLIKREAGTDRESVV